MSAVPQPNEVIHRVQLQIIPPPPQPVEKEKGEKMKQLVGKIIVAIGLILLAAALFVMTGHVIGFLAIGATTAQMLFTTSIVGILGGYYLANPARASQQMELTAGPLSAYL